ncbi:MAG TPA: COX15/CtaA family protein [Verrucomicrobiae bacterium]|jgi:cytochrome c oxidase assembly protein subunit 15|nr:COX15/CtaA family protein [Verrucomicrobiae bacterium]
MNELPNNRWLHRFAVLTALATLALIGIGGLVTSHEAGMSVPDWPTSYGYNMFFFPLSKWWHGGNIFYEHSHRLFASGVGFLTVILMVWLWISEPRKWLRWVGVAAFLAVVLQGVLGGLRVILFKDQIGIFHATLAQLFFVLTCAIALFTSKWWARMASAQEAAGNMELAPSNFRKFFLGTTILILLQLILGATMRHQHAGLSIRDFPLAYGKLWPATDAASVAHYNEQRVEITNFNPITAFQIELQMVHRIIAMLILCAVAFCAWQAWRKFSIRNPMAKLAVFWLGLILSQVVLGAATILSDKAADIATGHVLVGALSLATGAVLSIIAFQFPQRAAGISPAKVISEAQPAANLKQVMEAGSAGKMPTAR